MRECEREGEGEVVEIIHFHSFKVVGMWSEGECGGTDKESVEACERKSGSVSGV